MAEMKFKDWHWKDIEGRLLEAVETDQALPAPRGPKMFGNAMPDVVRDPDAGYGWNRPRYRKTASPGTISRYEETLDWMIKYLDANQRLFLWGWGMAKCSKSMRLSRFAHENAMNSRMLRRQIAAHCQLIAHGLNRDRHTRLSDAGLQLSEKLARESADTMDDVSPKATPRGIVGWMAEGAKPQLLPDRD